MLLFGILLRYWVANGVHNLILNKTNLRTPVWNNLLEIRLLGSQISSMEYAKRLYFKEKGFLKQRETEDESFVKYSVLTSNYMNYKY